MKLKTSCFNKGILRNDIKRFGWVGICYLIFLLFEVPFKILTINASNNAHSQYLQSMQNVFSNDELMLSTAVIPVLVAILLFRYIQSKKSVDMIHCLPIKRVKLYDNHIFIGILFLAVPVLITALAALLLKEALNLNNPDLHFTVKTVAGWAGRTILFNIVIFLSSVFVGMFTGLSSAQGILTYIFLFLTMGLTTLISYNLNFFVYGVANGYYLNNGIAFFSPIQRYIAISPMTSMEIFKYIIFSIILYLAARFAYHKRSLEAASNAVAFKHLQPVFKYGITFCCMLLGGIYFSGAYSNGAKYRLYWVMFGYAIASVIGYVIAEIIITKSLRIFRNIKGYFIYVIIIALVLIGINSDIIGYERRIPALENIESIYMESGFNFSNGILDDQIRVYSEKENLNNIEKLHKKLIEDKRTLKYSSNFNSNELITILYTLKNGKQINRQYIIPAQGYREYLKPIYESKESKKMHNNVLNIDYSSIDKISINSGYTDKNVTLISPREIKEALDILKNEALNETYKDIINSSDVWGHISILLSDDKRIVLSWKRSYKEFENWLKQNGYYAKTRIMPEDVEYALIEKRDPNNPHGGIFTVKSLKITDKNKLEACLTSCSNSSEGGYVLGLYMKNSDNTTYLNIEEEYVPNFVRKYLK